MAMFIQDAFERTVDDMNELLPAIQTILYLPVASTSAGR